MTAVDFSDEAVRRGRLRPEELGMSVTWKVMDLTDYTPEEHAYDLVYLFYLHMRWEEFCGVVRGAATALRPGGTLLVVGHDATNIVEGAGGPQDPDVLYAPDDVAGLLGGLELERAERMRRRSDHGDEKDNAVQIDCVVRARKP